MNAFFVFFFISGFCSILYEIVWLRLAMAQFGVTSALVSIGLSMFMAGLGLGSWASGHLLRKYEHRLRLPPLRLYAVAELLIAVSAVVVPHELVFGRTLLMGLSLSSSGAWYLAAGIWLGLTLIPWSACMGATIPVAMLAIRNNYPQAEQRSFSFLYLANVLGAVAGAVVPLFLIEIYGFHGTLKIGAWLNALLASSAVAFSLRGSPSVGPVRRMEASIPPSMPKQSEGTRLLILLFATGCTSMGAEVVWIRQFTPYLGTVVYAFAVILSCYLLSNFVGSRIYRIRTRSHPCAGDTVSAWVGLFLLLPLVSANPQFPLSVPTRLLLGIVPFSVAMGFLTPMLVDRWCRGDPEKAGSAYAVNVVGCILGPLIAGFLLLPAMSGRWVLFLFALPWLAVGSRWLLPGEGQVPKAARLRMSAYPVGLLALLLVFLSKDYEDQFTHREVLRDNTATVVAIGQGMRKSLLVNGVGMTILTPTAKMMAHLPLAFLDHAPRNGLVVCFGMGTTYRSLLSWNISSTAVELVPSVPRMFWYFHSDGAELLQSPLSRVIIDDGRRYLERTAEQYDVITVDPPPPIGAAGSSLLYSEEFLSTVKQRLRRGGILQLWLPGHDDVVVEASIARALTDSFPYARVFRGFWGFGFHFIASNDPIPDRTAAQLAERMADAAVKDLTEWGPQPTAEKQFANILSQELSLGQMIAAAPGVAALSDDRPVNEYYALRWQLSPAWGRYLLSTEQRGPGPARR